MNSLGISSASFFEDWQHVCFSQECKPDDGLYFNLEGFVRVISGFETEVTDLSVNILTKMEDASFQINRRESFDSILQAYFIVCDTYFRVGEGILMPRRTEDK